MTKRETFFAVLTLLAGMLWGVAMSQAAEARGDYTSVAGWIQVVTDKTPPALFWLVDCHGGPCDYPEYISVDQWPDDAIRMTGRSGDAVDDARVAAWLVRHDGQRIRVTWTVESKGAGR